MEVSPFADPVRVTAPDDTVWPINVAVPVDFSKVAPGDFLYLMHRPSAVDEWIPVTGARLDAARGVLVADVYSDGLFMPIRAKSDVADPRELVRLSAEVPDILRGRSDFDHPFVRLLQGDTDAIADVDTVLLSQYLEAIADGLDDSDTHRLPPQLMADITELVELSKQHTPSAAVKVPPPVGVTTPAPHPVEGVTLYAQGSEPYGQTAAAGGARLGAGSRQQAPASVALDLPGVLSHGAYWTGRFLGSRSSKPECNSDPPSWVQDILVVEDLNAEVFACGATVPVDELRDDLSLRIVSNRGYPIVLTANQLFGDEPRVEYEVDTETFAPDVSGFIVGLLRPLLAEDGQIFLRGTETVDLRFSKQSLRPILHLEFQSDASGWGLAVEIFISVLLAILGELADKISRIAELGSTIIAGWNCFSRILNDTASAGSNIVSLFEKFVTASCFDVWLGLLRDEVEKDLQSGFGNRLKGLKRALVVAVVAKLVAETTLRLGDFLVLGSVLSGVAPVTVTGRFTIRSPYVDPDPRPLGDWRPTCPSTAGDSAALSATSKDLYINLAAREKYTDRQYYLHEIPGWDSDAATAVTALTRCGAEAMAAVADYIQRDPENYWTEPKSTEVVADKIYETFPELGFGEWTAVCDNTAADIAAMHSNLASLEPFSASSPLYSRFKSFEPALEASAAPLKQCGADYVIELHERLSGSAVWTGGDRATVEAVVLDLLLGLPIVLPDANLNEAVRSQFDVEEGEEITVGDARGATSLNVSDSEIVDLDGLHYFINLSTLDASNNRIADFTPILALQHLRNIDLSQNRISDFSGLSGNDTITSLDISHNLATSLALDDMFALRSLDASNNQITSVALTELQSLTSVRDLTSSTALNLAGNPITDLKLGGLRRLSTVSLGDFPHLLSVELIAMPNLTSLTLNNTSLTHVRLDAHPSLSSINLRNNKLTDVLLSRLPVLSELDLSHNLLVELELVDFPVLGSVNVENNHLERLVLRGLGNVGGVFAHVQSSWSGVVDVGDNPLQELTVEALPNLTTLSLIGHSRRGGTMLGSVNVENNHLERLVLRGLGNVGGVFAHVQSSWSGVVDVGDNPLQELTVEALPNLTTLSLIGHSRRGGTITTLESITLSDLPMLQSLDVRNNMIDTLELVGFESLAVVLASNNRLTSVTLSDLPSLHSLYLARNMLAEIELAGFPVLSELDLSHNLLVELELVDFPVLGSVNVENNHLERLVLRGLGNVGGVFAHVQSSWSGVVDVGDNPLQELTVEALPNLTTLSLIGHSRRGGTITTLESITLSDLPMLQSLDVRNNMIDTLELVGFESLAVVLASNNRLTSVTLSDLPSLHSLYLARNMLAEIELAGFPVLSELDLSHNLLVELELVDFPVLGSVNVENNHLERLVLRGLGNVGGVFAHVQSSWSGVVDVGDNPLQELTVEALPNLTTLSLIGHSRRGGTITTLESITLSDLPMLQSLDVRNNMIDTLELVGFESLAVVLASNNRLTSVTLSDLPSLHSLYLARNMLAEIELAGFPVLSELDLSHNLLVELELVDFPVLGSVNVENNHLERLVLRGLGNVGGVFAHVQSSWSGVVDVGDNPLQELTVEALPNLTTLSLIGHSRRGGTITTLESITLSDLPMLQSLDVRNNMIDTLELVGTPVMTTISASNNRIVDIDDLESVISLVTLDLDRNDIRDVSPLASLVNLRTLRVAWNLISDFSPLDPLSDLEIHGRDSQRDE